MGFGQVLAPGYGAFVTEAVGFRMTCDIVALVCFFFGIAYFALAGGMTAFKRSCKKEPRERRASNDSDFIKALGAPKHEDDETVEQRSRRSSSFMMIGPTSPGVSFMRMKKTV